jgi:hypothetical protein
LREINVGEELLFNYGRKFEQKHGLDKKLPKVRDNTKKGVVSSEEALDVLDGIDARKKVQRGKMLATRGGHSSGVRARKQQKARKSAPNRTDHSASENEVETEPLVPVDEDEADEYVIDGNLNAQLEEAEDDEEDYEDDDEAELEKMARGRPRRSKCRPLKYTR